MSFSCGFLAKSEPHRLVIVIFPEQSQRACNEMRNGKPRTVPVGLSRIPI